MPRLLEHINFPRIAFVLAVVFMVSLGLCGLTAVFAPVGSENIFAWLGIVELAVMVLCILGLFVTLLAWIVASLLGFRYKDSKPQRLFDDSDDKI